MNAKQPETRLVEVPVDIGDPLVVIGTDGLWMSQRYCDDHRIKVIQQIEPKSSWMEINDINQGTKHWECRKCRTLGSPNWKRCPVCEAKMNLRK